ncbi:glycosyltransferase family 52 [Photobacterium indicum]|uniref:glycosyltransferase family 52 n=1 Tax=Photobacterium indicum TaxID=81447 RepID=UPI003D137EF3
MNVYICSTVRHLLFSLLKATYEKPTPSHIIFFYDYQDIDKNSFDLTALPDHITVSLLSRKAVGKKLSNSLQGKLFHFLAMRNAYLPNTIKHHFARLLGDLLPELKTMITSNSIELFVFNERNKMSRLFRLLVPDYRMIEDGMANYTKKSVSRSKKLIRQLQGKTPSYQLFGESSRCKAIYAVTPDAIPSEIRSKAKQIDFITKSENIGYLDQFFGYQPQQHNDSNAFIIATQPAFHKEVLEAELQLKIYDEIISQLNDIGTTIILKTHPSEDPESYRNRFPNIQLAPSKLPLELLLLSYQKKVNIISISSSAGLGFEHLCNKIELLDAEQISKSKPIMLSWQNNHSELQRVVRDKIKQSQISG